MPRKAKGEQDMLAQIAEYEFIPELSIAQRIAHFLDWAAVNAKRTYFPYTIVAKAIHGHGHVPRQNSGEVEGIKKVLSRVKEILRDKYKRGYENLKGVGVRACVDDNDTVNHSVANAAKRLVSAKANLDKSTAIVDPAKLSAKESAYFDHVTQASKRITSANVQALLLPPLKPAPKTAAAPQPRRSP